MSEFRFHTLSGKLTTEAIAAIQYANFVHAEVPTAKNVIVRRYHAQVEAWNSHGYPDRVLLIPEFELPCIEQPRLTIRTIKDRYNPIP